MSLSFRSRVPVFDANVGIGNREDWRLREASGAWGKCETPVEIVREIVQCRKRRLKLDIAN